MPDIYHIIGRKIRELRTAYKGRGISQEELAEQMQTTANTVSRWETATYKPSVVDLESLARFFGVHIGDFFPNPQQRARVNALLSATSDLDRKDLDEVTRYAQFRRARQQLKRAKRKA
jgi:transcriptional regulator with XRE-family HTH domain